MPPKKEIEALKDQFAKQNLERLAHFEPPQQPERLLPSLQKQCSVTLALLEQWSDENKDTIQKAIKSQVFGGKNDISWSTAFLPFMESTGVYLRDWGLLLEAWKTYRAHKMNKSEDERQFRLALNLYRSSTQPIEDLASKWGMDFFVLCDLVTEGPDGVHVNDWDGPYCGAFFTTDAQEDTPFIGVAFKGTNPVQPREVAVDYNYQLEAATGYLQDQKVSAGVYTGLFGTFQSLNETAYNHIIVQLDQLGSRLQNGTGPVKTHVTGHSLGGSYSSLCYGQLLIDVPTTNSPTTDGPTHIVMGDEYTFGAPRVGCQDWSELNSNLVHQSPGQSWRIVNDEDIVPQVPPTALKADTDFYHIDKGWKIFKDKDPEVIPTEQGGPPPTPYNVTSILELIGAVFQTRAHIPDAYYAALQYALQHP